jgi:ribosomal protein S18 acetylase RimI-like enzyme
MGIGKYLLQDAIHRTIAASEVVGAFALMVDAKDDSARGFYEHFGFERFPDDQYSLFVPVATLRKSLPNWVADLA